MADTDTEQRLHKLLVEHLGVAAGELKPDATLADDLGADSLDVIELEIACEDEFEVTLCEDDNGLFELHTTIEQMIAAIDAKRAD